MSALPFDVSGGSDLGSAIAGPIQNRQLFYNSSGWAGLDQAAALIAALNAPQEQGGAGRISVWGGDLAYGGGDGATGGALMTTGTLWPLLAVAGLVAAWYALK